MYVCVKEDDDESNQIQFTYTITTIAFEEEEIGNEMQSLV